MAEFYILVSLSGNPTDTVVNATLYYDIAIFARKTAIALLIRMYRKQQLKYKTDNADG